MGKIVFIDVDGTLVDYENHLPESAVLAIRKARENGHKVYISTGRSKAEIYQNIWDIGLDGMIGGNGSYVEDHGNPINGTLGIIRVSFLWGNGTTLHKLYICLT